VSTTSATPVDPPTWLNGGVPLARVAEWAGHGVAVPLKVYAKCIEGQLGVSHRAPPVTDGALSHLIYQARAFAGEVAIRRSLYT
jgi:hypothetical protein